MNTTPDCRRSAFSLIELLVVLAIVGIIISFAVPAATQMLKGSQLTQAAQLLSDQLGFARQSAISKNRPVEVRFYRYADLEIPGERVDDPKTWRFHGYQLFEVTPNGAAIPLSKMQRLPISVVADEDKYSTLLREQLRGDYVDATTDATAPDIPVKVEDEEVGRTYEYASFRFLQDGSTNLPPNTSSQALGDRGAGGGTTTNDSWYVTLLNETDLGKNIGQVNFFTLQIDAQSGNLKPYRPDGA